MARGFPSFTTPIALAISLSACSASGVATAPALSDLGAPRLHVRIAQYADLPHGQGEYPAGIVAGPDHSIWVICDDRPSDEWSAVVRIAESGKQLAVYNYYGNHYDALFNDVAVGPDGALWITDTQNQQIVRMTTDGTFTTFPLISRVGGRVEPLYITVGPDKALWFTAWIMLHTRDYLGRIGRITTGGKVKLFRAPVSVRYPWDIAAGADGALWFTDSNENLIGRMTTQGKFTTYPLSSTPYSIAAGADGALWFTEEYAIGRITTSGKVTEFWAGLTPGATPQDLVAGPDAAVWFTASQYGYPYGLSAIGGITSRGIISEYSKGLDPRAEPTAITTGPGGKLWFVEQATNETGRFTP